MKNLSSFFIVLTVFSILFLNCWKKGPEVETEKIQNPYEGKKIFCSMAGSGDPWSALTKDKRGLVLAMHDGNTLQQLSELFNKTEDQIKADIEPLLGHNLVKLEEGIYKPDFFISGIDETEKVLLHSKATGEELAEELMKYSDILERSFSELSISGSHTLKDQGFMLIGSRLLDMGVIGSLVRDGTLLKTPPSRPSPGRTDARYYFWMVEGEPHQLGKYGQEDTDLSWYNWHLLDFGASYLNGVINYSRKFFENTSSKILEAGDLKNPAELAERLKIPFFTKDDSGKWEKTVREISDKLQLNLKGKREEFRTFYSTLKSSGYTNNSFSEFFCWYYHLTYARAIDVLSEKGFIVIPAEGHRAAVMYFEGSEGLLTGK